MASLTDQELTGYKPSDSGSGILVPEQIKIQQSNRTQKMLPSDIAQKKKELRKKLEGVENKTYHYKQQKEYEKIFSEENLDNFYNSPAKKYARSKEENIKATDKIEEKRIKNRESRKSQAEFAHSNGLDKRKTNDYFEALKTNPTLSNDKDFVNYMNTHQGESGTNYASGYIGQETLNKKMSVQQQNDLKERIKSSRAEKEKIIAQQERSGFVEATPGKKMRNMEERIAYQNSDRGKAEKLLKSRDENGVLRYDIGSQVYNDVEKQVGPRPLDPDLPDYDYSRLEKIVGKDKKMQKKIANLKAQDAAEKAARETAENVTEAAGKAVKNNAEDAAKKLTKTKVGRIAAAVGVGALVVSNMNKNKGQQPNGQLYGQQTPYSY